MVCQVQAFYAWKPACGLVYAQDAKVTTADTTAVGTVVTTVVSAENQLLAISKLCTHSSLSDCRGTFRI